MWISLDNVTTYPHLSNRIKYSQRNPQILFYCIPDTHAIRAIPTDMILLHGLQYLMIDLILDRPRHKIFPVAILIRTFLNSIFRAPRHFQFAQELDLLRFRTNIIVFQIILLWITITAGIGIPVSLYQSYPHIGNILIAGMRHWNPVRVPGIQCINKTIILQNRYKPIFFFLLTILF